MVKTGYRFSVWAGAFDEEVDDRLLRPIVDDDWPAPEDAVDSQRQNRVDFELERRWLVWRDEFIRDGVSDLEELERRLIERRAEWERSIGLRRRRGGGRVR